MNPEELRTTLAAHFRAPARQDVIRAIAKLPNFFEGWFTAETLFALQRRWPSAVLSSNTNHLGFRKPDVVFAYEGLTAILELKHIATGHRDAQSRWDGAKDSTVAKDIEALRLVQAQDAKNITRRVLVFYGPASPVAHSQGRTCERNRLLCLACSVQHLSSVLVSRGGEPVGDPAVEKLIDDGTFFLLDITPHVGRTTSVSDASVRKEKAT